MHSLISEFLHHHDHKTPVDTGAQGSTEASPTNPNLWGIVDMGSNGIRYSITDLSPMCARIMPAIYSDRSGISLYDAQYKDGVKIPIPSDVINSVCKALRRFRRTCQDFGVPEAQTRIIATEATRVAINSAEYRAAIKDATGWEVEMLPKEVEGKTGAYGVASSFESTKGLMMDLGGGSTQITWIIAKQGKIRMSDAGSVSMPYGAAALCRLLDESTAQGGGAPAQLEEKIATDLKDAVAKIQIPEELLKEVDSPEGLNLYLSGGGFRGWGFMEMSQHCIKPYPIPIINGFKTNTNSFHQTDLITTAAAGDEDVFRVSDRRASQIKGVALLINCLMVSVPKIKHVYFAQGGVREGALYSTLSDEVKAMHPMEVATRKFATKSSLKLFEILLVGPQDLSLMRTKGWVHKHLVQALCQSMFIHNGLSKDIQAAAGLRSTTTGELASILGADHEERASLAIMLCERWGGSGALAPTDAPFQENLVALLGPEQAFWAMYFGRLAACMAEVYPAGAVNDNSLVSIKVDWVEKAVDSEESDKKHKKHKDDKKGDKAEKKQEKTDKKRVLAVNILCDPDTLATESFVKAVNRLEKLGKKKNWPGGEGGCKIVTTTKST